jgi:hypothetical protein
VARYKGKYFLGTAIPETGWMNVIHHFMLPDQITL